MEIVRKPFQGVLNIIKFNWPYFVLSGLSMVGLFLLSHLLPEYLRYCVFGLILGILFTTLFSLLVSYYIYDLSPLYRLDWLDSILESSPRCIVNIHAGLDETSGIICKKFPNAEFWLFDFYDPFKHPEASIKRARKMFPSNPGTKSISTLEVPLNDQRADLTLVILSAHEIRDREERVIFFKELKRITDLHGKIIIVEHLRDVWNFIAYNIGFLHFQPRASWTEAFSKAGLKIREEKKITAFITVFTLEHYDSSL